MMISNSQKISSMILPPVSAAYLRVQEGSLTA
jgi:hypothetical protein